MDSLLSRRLRRLRSWMSPGTSCWHLGCSHKPVLSSLLQGSLSRDLLRQPCSGIFPDFYLALWLSFQF